MNKVKKYKNTRQIEREIQEGLLLKGYSHDIHSYFKYRTTLVVLVAIGDRIHSREYGLDSISSVTSEFVGLIIRQLERDIQRNVK